MKDLVVPTKSRGVDITAPYLRAIMHPAALTASTTDPKAVAAGHDPMEIRLVTAPKRTLKTKLGTVKSLGPAFAMNEEIDGTKGAIALVGKPPKDFELNQGQRLVTIAVFDVPKTKMPKRKRTKPSAAVFPSIVGFEDPIISVKGLLTKFEDPIISFEDPIISFDNPIIAREPGLFDFEDPIISFDNPIIALGAIGTKVGKLPGKAPAKMVKGDLDPMALGFMASPSVYIGPASMTAEGMLGLVAAKGTLVEIGFGIVE